MRRAELDALYPLTDRSAGEPRAEDCAEPRAEDQVKARTGARAKARAEAEALPPVEKPPGPRPAWKRLAGREIARRAIIDRRGDRDEGAIGAGAGGRLH